MDKAKAEKKMVLMDFTGSDWCPPCKALHKNVLTSPEFEAYADKNLVLVEVDFPRTKPQTEELKAANKALAEKYDRRLSHGHRAGRGREAIEQEGWLPEAARSRTIHCEAGEVEK